jgi:hypothetical protein
VFDWSDSSTPLVLVNPQPRYIPRSVASPQHSLAQQLSQQLLLPAPPPQQPQQQQQRQEGPMSCARRLLRELSPTVQQHADAFHNASFLAAARAVEVSRYGEEAFAAAVCGAAGRRARVSGVPRGGGVDVEQPSGVCG